MYNLIKTDKYLTDKYYLIKESVIVSTIQSAKFSLKNKIEIYAMVTMSLILFILVSYIIYINFSYYWDFLHSDIASDLAFIREAASSFSLFPPGWAHINEMRFIYITTPAIFFYLLTGNVHVSYSLAASLMIIVNIALFYYMMSFKNRNYLAMLSGIIVLLIFFSRYGIFSTFSTLFVNASLSTHLATVFLTLGVYLRAKYKTEAHFKGEKILWSLTLLLAFAQGIQSTRMIVALYAPILFVELLSILRSVNDKNSRINGGGMLYALLTFLLNGLGILFVNFLTGNNTILLAEVGRTTVLNIVHSSEFIERLIRTFTGFFNALGLSGGSEIFSTEGFTFVIRATFIFVVLFVYTKIQKDNADKNLVDVLVVSVILNFLAQALTFMGMGERFNFTVTSLIAVIFIISFCNVLERIPSEKKNAKNQGAINKNTFYTSLINMIERQNPQKCLVSGLIVILLMGTFLSINTLRVERDPNIIEYRLSVLDFLKEENLTVGYGYFWQALSVTATANWDIQVIPLHAGITGPPIRQGVAYHDFYHNEDRVFLLAPLHRIEEAYAYDWMEAILQEGQRYDFPWGWIIYIFDYNPWAHRK